MKITATYEDLAKKKLFIATPMYGGMCHGIFAKSLADLSALCTKYNIPLQIYLLFNESLIPRARNYCCDEFLRSGATHFLFMDADIGFEANDVITMLAMQDDQSPYDILGGPYPKKCISWEKIVVAVNKGLADKNPNDLERYIGDYVFNPKAGNGEFAINEPCEVLEIGTGFLMVRRNALVKFQAAYPQYMYRPDHIRTEHFDGSREIMMFFQSEIDWDSVTQTGSKRYLSEDYWFCQKAQKIGIKTFLCPWMRTTHAGSYMFGGSLADLASIQVSATADPAQLKKNK